MRKGTTAGPCQPRGSSRLRTRCCAVRVGCALGEPERAGAQVIRRPGPCGCHRHARGGVPGGAGTGALVRDTRRCEPVSTTARPSGLRLAREARRPLDALRFRALRCQARASAGSHAQAGPDQRALRRALGRGRSGIAGGAGAPGAGRVRGPAAFEAARAGYCARGLGRLGGSWPPAAASSRDQSRSVMIDDLIEVLRICQEGEDARVALTEVARVVQARTRADAVVFAAAARRPLVVSWPAADRVQVDAAIRAIDTGLPIDPQGASDGTEAAHPVRYGGRRHRGRRVPLERSAAGGSRACRGLALGGGCGGGASRPRAGRLRGRAGVARHRGGAARSQPRHGGCAPRGGTCGGRTLSGAGAGRERCRQGAGRPRHPSCGREAHAAVLRPELRRPAR